MPHWVKILVSAMVGFLGVILAGVVQSLPLSVLLVAALFGLALALVFYVAWVVPSEREKAWQQASEFRKAQEKLQQHTEFEKTRTQMLTSLLEDIPTPVMLFDRRYNVLSGNRAAQQAFPQFAVDKGLLDILPEPKLPEKLEEIFHTTSKSTCSEIRVDVPELRYYSGVLQFTALEDDKSAGMIMLLDQTAVRWAVERGVKFVADVSHELRTPLTSMTGFLETLHDHHLNAKKRKEVVEIMQTQSSRMVALVEDLLDLSALDRPDREEMQELVDLAAVIRQEAAVMIQTDGKVASRLALYIPDQECLVVGNARRLAQVVHNLLSNALKYGKKGAAVTVTLDLVPRDVDYHGASDVHSLWQFSVEDVGEGIASHHLPHLTTRFYRIDRTRSRVSGGTGLGLAIVKHIVQNHQGLLKISSTLGKGSVFQVLLPSIVDGD